MSNSLRRTKNPTSFSRGSVNYRNPAGGIINFNRPTTVIDGREIYSDIIRRDFSAIHVAMQARRGDEAAIELCKAVELVISGTGDKPWFDYRDLG